MMSAVDYSRLAARLRLAQVMTLTGLIADDIEGVVPAVKKVLAATSTTCAVQLLDTSVVARLNLARKTRPELHVLVSGSESETLWHGVDANRSWFENPPPTLMIFSKRSAEAMSRHAPHFASVLGPLNVITAPGDIPDEANEKFSALIDAAKAQRYAGLYEVDTDSASSLQEMTLSLVTGFGDPTSSTVAWRRYGYLLHSILSSSLSTIQKYWPEGYPMAERTLADIAAWLVGASEPSMPRQFVSRPNSPQSATESADVLSDALQFASRAEVLHATLDACDMALEGYALFPGSAGRRAAFDWWIAAVQEAWHLRFAAPYHP